MCCTMKTEEGREQELKLKPRTKSSAAATAVEITW